MSLEPEVDDFVRTLKTLKSNDKYVINTLSVMALNARENPILSKEIVKLSISNIYKVTSALKLISFYVVDSIIKNVGNPYKELFAEKVIDVFLHTFQSNKDHKIRKNLYNLRLTWKDFFSAELMNKLDEEVQKLDPGWPLVLKFNSKSKSVDKKPAIDENNQAKSSPDSTTPPVNRDPRILKIIKPDEVDRKRQNCDDLFMIDRDGEDHRKLIAKRSRLDHVSTIKKSLSSPELLNGLFGSKDIDLRVPLNEKLNSEVMEMNSKNWNSDDVFKLLISKENFQNDFIDVPLQSTLVHPPSLLPNKKIVTQPPPPQPREPIWKINIDGFPQMPSIGIDPRLLSRCPFYDPSRTITIDGIKYTLHLDRIQPCIFVNNQLHAVRFYCQNVEVVIGNVPYKISPNELAHIKINRRYYIASLGGPGHELIINGWPYNVRIDGNIHQITVSDYTIGVQFMTQNPIQVNVQNPIPPYICDWAVRGFFGSPQYLNMPPLNPLKNQKLQDPQSFLFRNELAAFYERRNMIHTISINTELVVPAPEILPVPVSQNRSIDVHDLFQKLVATGIILPNKPTDLTLDITKYSWDAFKSFNDKETCELYSGHQCDLCGTRFKNKDSKEFELHLDYHFYKNTTNFTSIRKSRNFVTGSRQWVSGSTIRPIDPDFNFNLENCEQKFKCPMFEDIELNKCAVCMEGFEVAWDDEEEAFLLQDGQLHSNKVYHPICLQDADKQNQVCCEGDKTQIELTNQPLEALQKVLLGKIDSVVLPETHLSELNLKVNQSDQDFNYESAIN